MWEEAGRRIWDLLPPNMDPPFLHILIHFNPKEKKSLEFKV